jgi:hypothetical protein
MIGFYSSLWFFMVPFILYDLGSHCGSAQALLVALRFPGYFGCSLFVVSFRLFQTICFCLFRPFPVLSLAASLVPSYSVHKCQPPSCLWGKKCTLEDMSLFGYGKYLQISTAHHVWLRWAASALYGDL